jgi:hypothetical protein
VVVSHAALKEALLDETWASRWGYTCFSGDSKPFYFKGGAYRPDVVWVTKKGGKLIIIEIPMTEDERAVVGEFFLASIVMHARYFYVMVNEGEEGLLKPFLSHAYRQLMELTNGYKHPENCPMYRPKVISIPKRLGKNRTALQTYLDKVWK